MESNKIFKQVGEQNQSTGQFFRTLNFQSRKKKVYGGKKILSIFFVAILVMSGLLTVVFEANINSDLLGEETTKETENSIENEVSEKESSGSISSYKESRAIHSSTRSNNQDSDNDGLTDEEEEQYGTNPYLNDTDEDGLSDYDEIFKYYTCPYRESTDGDMYDDGMEILGHSPVGLGELGGDMPGYVTYPGNDVFCAAFPEIDIEISDNINVETVQVITTSHSTIETNTWDYTVITTDGYSIGRGTEETHIIKEWEQVHNREYDEQVKEDYKFQIGEGAEFYCQGHNLGFGATFQEAEPIEYLKGEENPISGKVEDLDLSVKEADFISSQKPAIESISPDLWNFILTYFYDEPQIVTFLNYLSTVYDEYYNKGHDVAKIITAASIASSIVSPFILSPIAATIVGLGLTGLGTISNNAYSINLKDLKDFIVEIANNPSQNPSLFEYNINSYGKAVKHAIIGGAATATILGGPIATIAGGTVILDQIISTLSAKPSLLDTALPHYFITDEKYDLEHRDLSHDAMEVIKDISEKGIDKTKEITNAAVGFVSDLIIRGQKALDIHCQNKTIEGEYVYSNHIIEGETNSGKNYESSYRTTENYNQYHETKIIDNHVYSITEEWGTAMTNDTSHAGELDFTFYLKNVGTDIAKDIQDLRFNILIGDSEIPITYPSLENDGISLSNLLPDVKVQFSANNIVLSLTELQAIDEGAPIRIQIAYYSFGEDQLYYESALGKCVMFQINDGVSDGDYSLDKYLIATWDTETYLQVLSRAVPVEFDDNYALLSINNQPINNWSYWNVKLTEYTNARSFRFAIAQPRTRVLMIYYQDSDHDHYNDRTEIKIGTDPNNASSYPAPLLKAWIYYYTTGDNTTVRLTLKNDGNYNACGIEARLYSVNGNTTVYDGFIGGEGLLKPGEEITLENDTFTFKATDNFTDLVAVLSYSHPEGSETKIISEWNLWNCIKTLSGHSNAVNIVDFSENNKWLASNSNDKTIKIWSTSNWSCIKTLTLLFNPEGLTFSSNNKWLASSYSSTIKIWSTTDWSCIKTLSGGAGSLAFSSDNKWLASSYTDATIKIWNTSDWSCIKTLSGHSYGVDSLAFSYDNKWLASCSVDETIKIWDTSDWSCIKTLTGHSSGVDSVAFSPNNNWLASGSQDETIKIWSTSNWSCIKTLSEHSERVYSVAFSHNNDWLASSSQYQSDAIDTIKIWSTSNWNCIISLTEHSGSVWSVAFSENNEWLASGSSDNTIKIWGASIKNLTSPILSNTEAPAKYLYKDTNLLSLKYTHPEYTNHMSDKKINATTIQNATLMYAFQYQNGTIIYQNNITTNLSVGNNTINLTWKPSDYLDKTAYNQDIKCVVKLVDSQNFLLAEDVVKMTIHDNRTDLFVYSGGINFSNPSPLHNDKINITAKIYNLGETNASCFRVSFYDGDPDENGTLIKNETVSALAISATTNVTVEWNATKGDHEIYVVVDSLDEIEESIEGDNIAHTSIHVRYRPDLEIEAIDLSLSKTNITEDDEIWINATIHNVGDVDAENIEVTIYADTTIISNNLIISKIEAESSENISLQWIAVWDITQIIIKIDMNNSILEVNESNNNASVDITVKHKPDLIPLTIEFSKQNPIEKDKITISSTIKNQGETDAFDVLVRFYVDNNTLDEIIVESIPAGKNRTLLLEWNPEPGNRQIKIVVDINNDIDEYNENNNELTEYISVDAEPPTVKLNSPNGGEDLIRNEHHIITWQASGYLDSTSINLYYSTNGGVSWNLIVSNIENNGTFNWTVPDIETATGLVKVSCEDIYGNNVSDTSDTTFAIDPPPPLTPQIPENTENKEKNGDESSSDVDKSKSTKENRIFSNSVWTLLFLSALFIAAVVIVIKFHKKKKKDLDIKKLKKEIENQK